MPDDQGKSGYSKVLIESHLQFFSPDILDNLVTGLDSFHVHYGEIIRFSL